MSISASVDRPPEGRKHTLGEFKIVVSSVIAKREKEREREMQICDKERGIADNQQERKS